MNRTEQETIIKNSINADVCPWDCGLLKKEYIKDSQTPISDWNHHLRFCKNRFDQLEDNEV